MTREVLAVMESTTTFGKQNRIAVSKSIAACIAISFLGCVVITGLLVYHFTSCTDNITECSSENSHSFSPHPPSPDTPEVQTTTLDQEPSEEVTTTTTASPKQADKVNVRLGRSILPHSYDIKLIPFVYEGNFTFHGEIAILMDVRESVWNITLHAADILVDEASVSVVQVIGNYSSQNNSTLERSVPVHAISNDTALQFLIIQLGQTLIAGGRYRLYMSFKGYLNNHLQGFYRSSYTVKNETRWIASTQFQPTDARRAFPCFDEPSFKAKFKISIGRPTNMSSISNMPRISNPQPIDGLDNYVWDHYQESVPMSTYLVAFVVSDFDHLNNGSISVWARHDAINQAKYSLKIAPSILSYYEDYFKIDFPLPKLDMIAIPDFSAGAMENWGLITYRETAMLYEEGVSKITSLQRIASVIAHELAHQWFGNLVTPSWWSDLWLNEGFASYVEYIGTDAVDPEWRMLDQFVIMELQTVFALDALKSSHQISVQVGHPAEINDMFDRISYAKGASIIRMMDHFLTNAVFKQGLTNYLITKKYSNAEQDDLWEALTDQAHIDNALDPDITVKEIMDTWTLQTGYPVVTATRNYTTNSLTLSQKRFLLIGNTTDSLYPLWWVPITYTTALSSDSISRTWLRRVKETTQTLPELSPSDWLLLNVHQSGYYRVTYDLDNWRLLINQLMDKQQFTKIHSTNRAQLLDDSLNLARAGLLDYEIALDLTRYLVHERDYIPWPAAFSGLEFLVDMLQHTGNFDKLKSYMLYLISGLYNEMGFKDDPNDSPLNIRKRALALFRACSLGQLDCVRNAVTHFQNWHSSPDPDRNNPIPPNLRGVVYCTAIRVGGEEEWNFAWERYQNSNVGTEKEVLLTALGCSRETWILSRYLEKTLNETTGIRKQDAPRVFVSVAGNIVGQDLVFRFIRTNWKRMKSHLGTSFGTLNVIIKSCTTRYNTQYELDNLKNFVKNNKEDFMSAPRPIEQAIEHIEANVEWMGKNYDTIVRWLSNVQFS